jgi:hypothetical protein
MSRYKKRIREKRKRERQSIRNEKRRLRQLRAERRKKMLKHKWMSFKQSFRSFINNPFKRKKKSRSEQIRREAFREARNTMIKEWILTTPQRIKASFLYFFQKRRFQWESIHARAIDFQESTQDILMSSMLRKELLTVLITSTSAYLITFVITFLLHNVLTVVTASFFDIPSVLFHSKIYWPLSTYSTLYYRGALIVIFGLAPMLMLFLSIFVLLKLFRKKNRKYFINLIIIWSFVHLLNLFFGAYADGVITRTGFIYATEWIFMNSGVSKVEVIFVFISVVFMLFASIILQRQFIKISFSSTLIEKRFRFWYLFFTSVLPWMFGTGFLFLYGLPQLKIEYVLLPLFIGIFVLPTLIGFRSPKLDSSKAYSICSSKRINLVSVGVTMLVLFIVYIGFYSGFSIE